MRRMTSRQGGADEPHHARGNDAWPCRGADVNRQSPIAAVRSRRGFLAALSAGAVSAVASPIAFAIPAPSAEVSLGGLTTAGDDSDLFKLLENHRAAAAEERLLYKAFEKFEAKWFKQQRALDRQIPEVLRRRPEDQELGLPEPASESAADAGFYRNDSEVDRLRSKTWKRQEASEEGERHSFVALTVRPSPAARARADEIATAFDKWQKRRDRRPRGYRAAERAIDAAGKRLWDLECKIIGTPAHSLAGIIAKARQGHEVGDEERFGVALIADLLALGTEHAGKAPQSMPNARRIADHFGRNT
jgi:hypothetical protein